MSTTTPICPVCGKPIHDNGFLCATCGQTLTKALTDIARLHSELDVTLTRQAKITSDNTAPPPPETDSTPEDRKTERWGVAVQLLPFHTGASDVARALDNTITTWARLILAERGLDLPPIPDPPWGPLCNPTECKHKSCIVIRWRVRDSEITHAAKFIAKHVWWLRYRREAEEAYSDIVMAALQLERIMDRPAPLKYAGPCNICRKDLYVREGAGQVECRPCDMSYDMDQRREYLLEQVEDRLERTSLIARAVTDLGSPISADRIRKWAQRGQLIPHATDRLGRPLYRIGDVRDLLATDTRGRVSA